MKRERNGLVWVNPFSRKTKLSAQQLCWVYTHSWPMCVVWVAFMSPFAQSQRRLFLYLWGQLCMQLSWPWKAKNPCPTVNSIKIRSIPILGHKFWMFSSELCTSWPLHKYLLTCWRITEERCVHENEHTQHLSGWPWARVLLCLDYCFLICKRYSA